MSDDSKDTCKKCDHIIPQYPNDTKCPHCISKGHIVNAPPAKAIYRGSDTISIKVIEQPSLQKNSLLMQSVITPKNRVAEGFLIECVTIPWLEIINFLSDDPSKAFQISPEKWEEIIAGAYRASGFDEVILTHRSGDYGRDVIAIKKGIGEVRVIDQVKAYSPQHLVKANDVRALMGVLQTDGASKGFITTTSDFAPKIKEDPLISPLIPQRLELINGQKLMKRLQQIANWKR